MSPLKKEIIASKSAEPQRSGDQCVQKFVFAENFIGFEGHFPGRPVLPAIAQMLTALTVAEELQGESLTLAEIPKAKFLSVLSVGEEVTVTCKKMTPKKFLRFQIEIASEKETAATFVLHGEELS